MTFKPLLSSITKKLFMAITGACFVLFVTVHGIMNFVSIFSAETYLDICDFLGANWYAVIATVIIAGFAGIHLLTALILSIENFIARGRVRYRKTERPKGVEWSSRNMIFLGLFILFGLVLHLVDFWSKMQLAELLGREPANGIEQIKFIFSNNYFSIMYLLWLVTLWFHLTHGIWSMLQSVGWNGERINVVWQVISYVAATIIVLMFASVVVYYWLIV